MSNDPHSTEHSAADAEDMKAVQSIPLDTEDGGSVVIEQQNMGGVDQVGGGEYKNVAEQRSVDDAAAEQARLEHESPVDEHPAAALDPDAPGLSVLDEQDGDPVEPNEPA